MIGTPCEWYSAAERVEAAQDLKDALDSNVTNTKSK